ncbi:MAG TPA: hypothetical protein VHO43_15485 [Ignavibacteriales bacterium]|nr:hypothetical protein [Ignavibacteriales bacterium]
MKTYILLFSVLAVLLTGYTDTRANDRRFTYIYETLVLSRGARELEIWNTYRANRGYYYRRLDQRAEFEFGLGNNLMSALYLNSSWRLQDENGAAAGGDAVPSQEVSISSEWKYKLLDRVANPLGLGLYGEATVGLNEVELEGKLLMDKQIGNLLVAFNGVVEHEWETELENGVSNTAKELNLEFDLGASYMLSGSFSLGLEFRNTNTFKEGEVENSVLFAGPVLAYADENWWAALTVMPQVTAFKGATDGKLSLDDHERVETRLLFSFHL